MEILIAIALFIGGLILGFLFRKMVFEKTVGCLILNESDLSKEYFEFHFEEDVDDLPDKGIIGFRLARK